MNITLLKGKEEEKRIYDLNNKKIQYLLNMLITIYINIKD